MFDHANPWTFVHQEYPKCLHKPDGSTCLVGNDAERDAKLADGWHLRPGPAPEPVAVEPPPVVEDQPPDAPVKARKKR